jgi:hypothetical protein
MPVPLMITPPPPGWELFTRAADLHSVTHAAPYFSGLADDGLIPPALLRPLAPLFGPAPVSSSENFLSGLQADHLLGARFLPASGRRFAPLAWIGLALRDHGRKLFSDLRGGCWIPGFPAIGRGRELLRAADLADRANFCTTMAELGAPIRPDPELYFNFHESQPATACARIYVLDATARRLHAFALPPSILAPAGAK